MTRLLRVLLPEELGGLNHVLQTCLRFVPSSRLQTAVGVDPQLVWLEVLKHLLKTVLDLLLAWNTRAVDVVNTWTNMAWISLVNEDLEQLGPLQQMFQIFKHIFLLNDVTVIEFLIARKR